VRRLPNIAMIIPVQAFRLRIYAIEANVVVKVTA
jgi:hypothetical protein